MSFKRILDIIFSSILIILTAPLMLLIIILIKIDSFGPAIFKQTRIGINRRQYPSSRKAQMSLTCDRRKYDLGGRPFTMYKFRSMIQEAEAVLPCLVDLGALSEPVYKLKHDPRITRFGKLLRKSSLDELPQIFNVLKGDMSLVGPRPEAKRVVLLYNEKERKRLNALPGITGLQQIKCRGTQSMEERLKYDMYYIQCQSFLLDLWILFLTIFFVIVGKGAY